jgi:hypothetical protein
MYASVFDDNTYRYCEMLNNSTEITLYKHSEVPVLTGQNALSTPANKIAINRSRRVCFRRKHATRPYDDVYEL